MISNNFIVKLINQLLKYNQGSLQQLSKFNGYTFKISLPGFNISGQIDRDGFFIPLSSAEYTSTIKIPLSTSSYLIDKDKLAVYKKININGDTKFGRGLIEILSKLHFEGLYENINSPIAMIIINQLSSFFSFIKEYTKHSIDNTVTSLKEYLLYETEDLITHHENDQFCDEVDNLRSRTDILEEKIKSLKSRGI